MSNDNKKSETELAWERASAQANAAASPPLTDLGRRTRAEDALAFLQARLSKGPARAVVVQVIADDGMGSFAISTFGEHTQADAALLAAHLIKMATRE